MANSCTSCIWVKNVVGMSNGLLITGCEIQGNADIQVMVEIGANIFILVGKINEEDIKEGSKVEIGDYIGNESITLLR
ncbi:MAG: hypothetical protein WA393_13905 [Nitrososphaeraceae archaeon]